MNIFIDTTALYALLDEDDKRHVEAVRGWTDCLTRGDNLITTNYVVIECWTLLQKRLGLQAARVFHEELLPIVRIQWVSADLHDIVAKTVLSSARRSVSIVDRASFEIMRLRGVEVAFTFDKHFSDEGFTLFPPT